LAGFGGETWIWVNGTAVLVGFILLLLECRSGWGAWHTLFAVYLTCFAGLLICQLVGFDFSWVQGLMIVGMATSWIWFKVTRNRAVSATEAVGPKQTDQGFP
jgi:hypothetical protein